MANGKSMGSYCPTKYRKIMKELLKKAFIEGYKQRAEGSDLIFDETSEMYAEHIFEKWVKGQSLPIDGVIKSYSEKNMDDAYDKGYNDGASAAATDIMNSL